MSIKKEFRVYVVATENLDDYGLEAVSNIVINSWSFEETLPELANKFIEAAEDRGLVYSLEGFTYDFNSENVNSFNDFIFITDKY